MFQVHGVAPCVAHHDTKMPAVSGNGGHLELNRWHGVMGSGWSFNNFINAGQVVVTGRAHAWCKAQYHTAHIARRSSNGN